MKNYLNQITSYNDLYIHEEMIYEHPFLRPLSPESISNIRQVLLNESAIKPNLSVPLSTKAVNRNLKQRNFSNYKITLSRGIIEHCAFSLPNSTLLRSVKQFDNKCIVVPKCLPKLFAGISPNERKHVINRNSFAFTLHRKINQDNLLPLFHANIQLIDKGESSSNPSRNLSTNSLQPTGTISDDETQVNDFRNSIKEKIRCTLKAYKAYTATFYEIGFKTKMKNLEKELPKNTLEDPKLHGLIKMQIKKNFDESHIEHQGEFNKQYRALFEAIRYMDIDTINDVIMELFDSRYSTLKSYANQPALSRTEFKDQCTQEASLLCYLIRELITLIGVDNLSYEVLDILKISSSLESYFTYATEELEDIDACIGQNSDLACYKKFRAMFYEVEKEIELKSWARGKKMTITVDDSDLLDLSSLPIPNWLKNYYPSDEADSESKKKPEVVEKPTQNQTTKSKRKQHKKPKPNFKYPKSSSSSQDSNHINEDDIASIFITTPKVQEIEDVNKENIPLENFIPERNNIEQIKKASDSPKLELIKSIKKDVKKEESPKSPIIQSVLPHYQSPAGIRKFHSQQLVADKFEPVLELTNRDYRLLEIIFDNKRKGRGFNYGQFAALWQRINGEKSIISRGSSHRELLDRHKKFAGCTFTHNDAQEYNAKTVRYLRDALIKVGYKAKDL